MIYFDRVSEGQCKGPDGSNILADLSFRIPPGRYALLAADNAMRRPVLDIITGARPPQRGRVYRDGLASWAVGRAAFIRGRFTGHQLTRLVARLYHLDRRLCEGVVSDFMTRSDLLPRSIQTWDSLSRMELGHVLALLPNFDIYAYDGVLPYRKGRFSAMWRVLVEQRLSGKTLIMSTTRPVDAIEFCDKALIIDYGQITVSDQLERALVDYPPRPTTDATEAAPQSASVDDDII